MSDEDDDDIPLRQNTLHSEDTVFRIRELDLENVAPSTRNAFKKGQGGSKTVVIGKPGTGKCLAAGTLVMLYDGSCVPVENIAVGDLLMGDDSLPREVVSLCAGREEMFRIRTPNASSDPMDYTVNASHILTVFDARSGNITDITIPEFLSQPLGTYLGIRVGVSTFGCNPSRRVGTPFTRAIPQIDTFLETAFEEGRCLPRDGISVARRYMTSNLHARRRFIGGIDSNPFSHEVQDTELTDCIRFIRRSTIDVEKHCIYAESVGVGTYYGFQLTGGVNKRFLLGDFTVTHNTTLITSLLYAKKHIFPTALVMSGSEDSNHFYKQIIPSTFVYNEYNEKVVEAFIRRQKIAKEHLPNPWSILLLDDCTDDPTIFNKPLQHGLFKRSRHNSMWYILSLQYAIDVKPVIRVNIDNTFILREPSIKIRKVIWENYASIIPDFSTFCQLMDSMDDYTALFIQNQTTSNKVEDCVFWYKAKIVPSEWKFGSKDYWKFHSSRYNDEYKESY